MSKTRLAHFVVFQYYQHYSYATIRSRLSGISYFHKIMGYSNPVESFLVNKLLYSIRLKRHQTDKRLPITIPILGSLLTISRNVLHSIYDQVLFRAVFTAAFFGLLRMGELSLTETGKGNVIRPKSVKFITENRCEKALIHLMRYKHHAGNPATIVLHKEKPKAICPVRALKKFHALRPSRASQYFCHANGSPLLSITVRKLLRCCISQLGLNPSKYTPHSFRIGGATHAFTTHSTPLQIQKMGRWKSNAYKSYVRP